MSERPFNFLLAKAGSGTIRFAADETVFRQADEGDCMYYLQSGEVAIEIDGKYVRTLGPGNVFGEMSLIDEEPRCATIRTISECDISKIDQDTFLNLVTESPYVALDIMRMLTDRLRKMSDLT